MTEEINITKEVKKWGDSLVIILTEERKILELEEGDILNLKISKIRGGK